MTTQNRKRLSNAGIVLGVLLCLSPLYGGMSTVIALTQAFQAIGAASGAEDPGALGQAVGETLITLVTRLYFLPIGVPVLLLSLILRGRTRVEILPQLPGWN